MSLAPSITWPLVRIKPSLRMKNPVPMPRTGVSEGPPLPVPYMRSRNSRKGSFPPPRAVVATMPTTAGIDVFTSAEIDAGGAAGRSFTAGASVQRGFAASSNATSRTMRARVGTPACSGQLGLLLDHRRDEILGPRVGGARRPLAVEEHAELVVELRIARRHAAHLHVADQVRDDAPGALRVTFAARGERVEDRTGAAGLPSHRRSDRLLHVAGIEPALQPRQGEREPDHHRHRDRPALPWNPKQFRHGLRT